MIYHHELSFITRPVYLKAVSIPLFMYKTVFKLVFSDSALSPFSFRKARGSRTAPEAVWHTYHGVLDDSGGPAVGHVLGVAPAAPRAVEAALHVVAVVEQHPQHDLVLEGVLQSRGEMRGVHTAEVVDVGPVAEQQVH